MPGTLDPQLIDQHLKNLFGHECFRPGQRQIVETLLAGRSALAVFPTGGGKSLCYQLPAILLEGTTLVVSPLIALMKDQVDRLRSAGIPAARLDSTLEPDEAHRILESLSSYKLLYLAPERLSTEAFQNAAGSAAISLLAVDEAHCISGWGHNFRPDYLRLSAVAKKLRIRRVLALTATATPEVIKDIRRQFRIRPKDVVRTSFHRPNLSLHITPAKAEERAALLLQKLSAPGRLPAVVYVTLQHTAEGIATGLQKSGVRARAYHAGLADEVRSSAQEDFMTGRCDVIVATMAFGMGVDKADIRSVIHYNLPKSLEDYQQEIGRAGRDGNPAHCELLACADDLIVLRNFTIGDTPDEASLRNLVDRLLRQGDEFDISRFELSRTTDIRPLVVETVITYLEQAKILAPAGTFHSRIGVAFRHTEDRILAGYPRARRALIQKIFASGRRGRIWLGISPADAARAVGRSDKVVLGILSELQEAGDVELRPSGIRHRFRRLPGAETRSPREIADWLCGIFSERESADLQRLEDVVAFATKGGCLTRKLVRYFGEKMAGTCGHCARCFGAAPRPLPRSKEQPVSLDELRTIRELRAGDHAALRGSRALARFLCGISSPAATRDRLTRHDSFGMLEHVPFHRVLEQISS